MSERLDKELALRKLANSRTKAKELISCGFVSCNGKVINKPNYQIKETDRLEILKNDKQKFVSRGGLKLEKAIQKFNLDFKDKTIMDIGSSTGGFTDCSLQRGAKKVIAIDVGSNLMDEKLRSNKNVELYEQTNIKDLPGSFFTGIDIITIDVSFISLVQIIEKLYNERVETDIICLIKPQFECGREIVKKYKGIILNSDVHKKILKEIIIQFNKTDFYIESLDFSPIRGGDGNIEYIAHFSNTRAKRNNLVNTDQIVELSFETLK